MKKQPTHKCLNCEIDFDFAFDYCPSCGQKNTDGKITFSELWVEFQDAVFNIESRTWRTLTAVFIPGKLTLEYFAGKHRRYVHPLRLLIVTSLLTIIALSFQDVQSKTNHKFVIKDRIMENYERQRVHHILNDIVENTKTIYPDSNTTIVTDTIMDVFKDSLDNLLHQYGDKYGDSINLNQYIVFTAVGEFEQISKHDFLNMTEDELVEKYKGEAGPIDQLIFRQKAKYIKDETQLASAMVGRFTWAILLMMPCVALILYLLYLKSRIYYIEHLIFTFHFHAFSFIVMTVTMLGWNIFPNWVFYLCLCLIEYYLFIAMWKVYKQGIFMTLLKIILLNIFYFVLLLLFVAGTFFISFFLL